MLNKVNSDNILPYITRIAFERLMSFYREENKPYLNYYRMLWERDIFFDNIDKLKQIRVQDNFGVYELEYFDYRLFFIIDIKPWNNRIRVFFVNIFKLDTFYEGYKDESIMKFKDLSRSPIENYIYVDNKKYNAIHVGNAFNKYKELKVSNLSVTESMFWEDIQKFYKDEEISLQFTSSFIGDFMIVHSVSVKS